MELGRFELCLNVADIGASKNFYETMGLRVVAGDEKAGYLILAGTTFTLGLFQGHIPSNLMCFRGRDVFAIAKELETRGLSLHRPAEQELDGTKGAWLKDPDGNLIYFNTAPGESEN